MSGPCLGATACFVWWLALAACDHLLPRTDALAGRLLRGGHFRPHMRGVHGRDVVRWARACACDVCMSGACSGNRRRCTDQPSSKVGFRRLPIGRYGREGVTAVVRSTRPDAKSRLTTTHEDRTTDGARRSRPPRVTFYSCTPFIDIPESRLQSHASQFSHHDHAASPRSNDSL